MKRNIALLAAVLLAPAAAIAQVRWYGGIAGGEAATHRELVANRESTITLATGIRTDFDRRDAAWKAFGGARINSVLALEATYADLGSHTMVTTLQGGDPPMPAAITVRRRIAGYGVDLVAAPPFGWDRVSLFGRAGAFRSRLEATAELDGNIVFTNGDPGERRRDARQRETVFKWGLGAEVRLARNVFLRADWERYCAIGKAFAVGGEGTTGEADTDVLSLGLVARF